MQTPSEFVAAQRANVRTQKVFEVLVDHAPNGMRLPHLKRRLPTIPEEQILEALNALAQKGRVAIQEAPNQRVPGRTITSYSLTNSIAYPMRETITIGGVEFPRAFNGDLTGAEDLNALSEAIAEYDAKIESRITDLAASMTRRYWANIATLFALFVGVFALILRATDPVVIDVSADPWRVAYFHAAKLVPLAVVLFGFVFATWISLRKL